MENNLIGKCFISYQNADIVLVKGKYYIGSSLCYMCDRFERLGEDRGYICFPGSMFDSLGYSPLDRVIWDKIHKILRMNTAACSAILKSAKKSDIPTGYTLGISTKDYRIFQQSGDSEVLLYFSENYAYFLRALKMLSLFERNHCVKLEWILPETYSKVKDTINQINDIWPIV